jgi:hypothetical protein
MLLSTRPSLRPLWFFLGGLALALWLHVFLADTKRPVSTQERADRLAAANISNFALTAYTPPSPAHWAQRDVWQDADTGARHPLSRDSAAILIATCLGEPAAASILAFGLAAAALAWCLASPLAASGALGALVPALALLGVAHGRAWQMVDPFPFILLASAAVALGAWLRFRTDPSKINALLLGAGGAALLLSAPALFIPFVIIVLLDAYLTNRANASHGTATLGKHLPALVFVVPVFAFWGLRNQVLLGNPFLSPSSDYIDRFVSAPRWFWQFLATPPPNLDPVFERYDELVAIPGARWLNPVYQAWLLRFQDGAGYAGGAVLSIAALLSVIVLPSRETRAPWFMILSMLFIAALRYPLSSAWWPFITPALAYLGLLGISRARTAMPQDPGAKLLVAFAIVQVFSLPFAPKAQPTEAEYAFEKRRDEVAKKLRETDGRHLVFVQLDSAADGRIEPADLPRDWSDKRILYARDLKADQNAALVAAMPDRQPWRILVFRDRIGLQSWKDNSKTEQSTAAPPTAP